MSPIKVRFNNTEVTLGPGSDRVKTPDDVFVTWSGDGDPKDKGRNKTEVHLGEKRLASHTMPYMGTSADVVYEGFVPPIEYGKSTTPVKREIRLERE